MRVLLKNTINIFSILSVFHYKVVFIDDGEIEKETGKKQNQRGRWRTYLKQNIENNSILFNNHFIFIIFYI